jgi:hypothetical protein
VNTGYIEWQEMFFHCMKIPTENTPSNIFLVSNLNAMLKDNLFQSLIIHNIQSVLEFFQCIV